MLREEKLEQSNWRGENEQLQHEHEKTSFIAFAFDESSRIDGKFPEMFTLDLGAIRRGRFFGNSHKNFNFLKSNVNCEPLS